VVLDGNAVGGFDIDMIKSVNLHVLGRRRHTAAGSIFCRSRVERGHATGSSSWFGDGDEFLGSRG
jgi:hypothetical protein